MNTDNHDGIQPPQEPRKTQIITLVYDGIETTPSGVITDPQRKQSKILVTVPAFAHLLPGQSIRKAFVGPPQEMTEGGNVSDITIIDFSDKIIA